MQNQRRFEWCQQCGSEEFQIAVDTGLAEQADDVCDAECAGRAAESEFRCALRCAQYISLYFHHCDSHVPEGDQSVYRWCAGAKWRRAEHEGLLEFSFGVIEERLHQTASAAEAPKNCALAHTGAAGDGVHRDCVDAEFGYQESCGVEEKCPVTCGVAALGRLRADLK